VSYMLRRVAGVRADRLVAIVLLLQSHGQLTAADLAERLETSERTIRRDLDALSGSGVPVYAQRGRGGGWALLGGHKLNLSGLTVEEAQALFLVAGPNALSGLGVEPGVRSALRKLMAALPAQMRDQAAAARSAVLVDPVGWGKRSYTPRHLDTLREAVVAGVQVVINYAKPGQDAAERRVHPYGLVSKGGTWYLLAGAETGLRTFRVSRVRGVVVTEDAVERPEDFDLAQAWDAVQSSFPHRIGTIPVELRVDPGVVPMLNAALRGWASLEPVDGGDDHRRADAGRGSGWGRFTASFPSTWAAAAELVRFVGRVEVISPPEVRAELAGIGRSLVAAYDEGGAALP
jgi:predicted DNA-binding transcriptional regulator YafY